MPVLAVVQGLAALLVQGLSGCSPQEVAALSPDWIRDIGLQQSLTPSRNNGFFNMFALMRQKAAELASPDPHVSARCPGVVLGSITVLECSARGRTALQDDGTIFQQS